jgi:hypothetical protein
MNNLPVTLKRDSGKYNLINAKIQVGQSGKTLRVWLSPFLLMLWEVLSIELVLIKYLYMDSQP